MLCDDVGGGGGCDGGVEKFSGGGGGGGGDRFCFREKRYIPNFRNNKVNEKNSTH